MYRDKLSQEATKAMRLYGDKVFYNREITYMQIRSEKDLFTIFLNHAV